MTATVDSIYQMRLEEFRRLQTSLARMDGSGFIDLEESAMDSVYLDGDSIFCISKLPLHGDFVYLTVNVPELTGMKEEDCKDAKTTSEINLDVLSLNVLDSLIRVMKKALIIWEVRTLV